MINICSLRFSVTSVLDAAYPEFANVNDGHCCVASSGMRLSVGGSAITMPSGNQITGDYNRHEFCYMIPAPEQPAGKTVTMSVVDEENME